METEQFVDTMGREIVLDVVFSGCCGTVYFYDLHLSSHINVMTDLDSASRMFFRGGFGVVVLCLAVPLHR